MITQNIKRFQLGVDPYPDWFIGFDQSKVTYNLDTDGELISVEIFQGQGKIIALKGDSLGMLDGIGTIVVIPQDAAKKYM